MSCGARWRAGSVTVVEPESKSSTPTTAVYGRPCGARAGDVDGLAHERAAPGAFFDDDAAAVLQLRSGGVKRIGDTDRYGSVHDGRKRPDVCRRWRWSA